MIETKVKSKVKLVNRSLFDRLDIEVFNTIEYDNNLYKLKKPLVCNVRKEEGYYYIESKELDIIAGGKTRQEAIRDFSEDFNFTYNEYNATPENELSERLVDVKNFINNIVLSVNNAGT
jgi:hypothetical protein